MDVKDSININFQILNCKKLPHKKVDIVYIYKCTYRGKHRNYFINFNI